MSTAAWCRFAAALTRGGNHAKRPFGIALVAAALIVLAIPAVAAAQSDSFRIASGPRRVDVAGCTGYALSSN